MKLWIIYKNGIGFSRIIAEILQDRLEDYIDVSVGNAENIEPAFLIEERLDYLIIGDVITKEIPSLDIQNWLLKYREISKNNNLIIKTISGFYVATADIKIEPFWIGFLQDNVNAEIKYPEILRLNLRVADLSLEKGAPDLIKDYSKKFIEYLLKNEKLKNRSFS